MRFDYLVNGEEPDERADSDNVGLDMISTDVSGQLEDLAEALLYHSQEDVDDILDDMEDETFNNQANLSYDFSDELRQIVDGLEDSKLNEIDIEACMNKVQDMHDDYERSGDTSILIEV